MNSIVNPAVVNTLKIQLSVLWYSFVSILQWIIPRNLHAKQVHSDTVLVTGAGSGLGRRLALEFAKLGSGLVLWDIDEQGMAETRRQVEEAQKQWAGSQVKSSKPACCLTYRVDVSDRQLIYQTAKQVNYDLKRAYDGELRTANYVSILVNNAGIYHGLLFQDLSDQQIERIVKINLMAHFWTVRAFLPEMIERERGHILEIASMAGISGLFKQVDYCATKFATVGFEEALSFELDYLGLANKIHTTAVCPFFFGSNLFTGFRGKRSMMRVDYVASEAVWALRCNHHRILLPKFKSYLFNGLRNFLGRKSLINFCKLFQLAEALKDIKGKAAADCA